ncbi:MAG: CsbD family protein [Acidobacteria bacterium]|nr:MAG: CsbD family protein [Acidobacteriota bacterium]
MWNDDEVKGKGKQIKGAVKSKVGKVTGDHDLENEGEAEKTGGQIQEGFGNVRKKAGKAIEEAGEAIAGKR